ncbi:MAG TPA: anti-sigma factor [Rubrobacter sp.]
MSEHPDTRHLLGPYVMGALDPREEREIEDHLRECAGCREEASELQIVHERLLDLAYATEAPPRELEERVVTEIPRRQDPRRLPSGVAAVAAVFCVLAVVGAIFVPNLTGGRALASATLSPTDLAPDAGGEVSIEDAGENMEVRLEAWGLPPCDDDRYYELWLVEGEERVSAGSFAVGPSGRVEVNMNAPDFAGSYPAVGITYEHDKDPRASDTKMLSGELHKF